MALASIFIISATFNGLFLLSILKVLGSPLVAFVALRTFAAGRTFTSDILLAIIPSRYMAPARRLSSSDAASWQQDIGLSIIFPINLLDH